MKKLIKRTSVVILITVSIVTLGLYSSDDISVNVDGYDHAVALCIEGDDEPVFTITKGTPWNKEEMIHTYSANNIMYMIEAGHLNDKEISILTVLATIRCARFIK